MRSLGQEVGQQGKCAVGRARVRTSECGHLQRLPVFDATMWSPLLHRASRVEEMAAMPEEQA